MLYNLLYVLWITLNITELSSSLVIPVQLFQLQWKEVGAVPQFLRRTLPRPSHRLLFLPWSSERRCRASHRFISQSRSRVFCGDKRRPSKIKGLALDSVERPATQFFRKAFDMVHALWHGRTWAYGASSLPSASQPHQKERGLCGSPQCRPPLSKRRLEEAWSSACQVARHLTLLGCLQSPPLSAYAHWSYTSPRHMQ